MAGPAASVFERIADVIEREQRQALSEYALTEWLWQCHADGVTDSAGPPSVGCSRHAA